MHYQVCFSNYYSSTKAVLKSIVVTKILSRPQVDIINIYIKFHGKYI